MLAIVSGQGPRKTDSEMKISMQEVFWVVISVTSPISKCGRHNWAEKEVRCVVTTEDPSDPEMAIQIALN